MKTMGPTNLVIGKGANSEDGKKAAIPKIIHRDNDYQYRAGSN